MTEPAAWSKAIHVGEEYMSYYNDVIDTGVGGIVILGLTDSIEAVDLDAPEVLWTMTNGDSYYLYFGTLDDGSGLVLTSGPVLMVDLRSGETIETDALEYGERVVAIDDGLIITAIQTDTENEYCGHSQTDFSAGCLWTVGIRNLDEQPMIPMVFGDGRWMNAADGVFDIFTGEMASFGADSTGSVYYAGPRDGVVRVSMGKATAQMQPWDTTNGRALSAAVEIKGDLTTWIQNDQPNKDRPWLLTQEYSDSSTLVLRAYSWQTGQMLWETPMKLGKWTSSCAGLEISSSTIMVLMNITLADPPIDCSNPQYAVVDGGTGRVLVQRKQDFNAVGAGSRVVYLAESPDWALVAHDMASSGFDTLWTMPVPGESAGYVAAAGHIFAWSYDDDELWVLQP